MSDLSPSRLAVMRAVNRLCDEFESKLGSKGSPTIAQCLEGLPEEVAVIATGHLVALDIDYRRLRGESPQADDYAMLPSLDRELLTALLETAPDPGDSMPNQQTPPRLASDVILGDYVIGDLIGVGGMGAVYQATHKTMRRLVAIKVIDRRDASAAAIDRFRREAEAAARLSHPNVVRAYDAGEQEGLLYLAMELIDGENLTERVARSGPLSVNESIEVIRQAALGLAHAHEQSLVHRDVKPSNLVITKSGEVKLLDLGVSRLAELPPLGSPVTGEDDTWPQEPGVTSAGQLLGTIDYLAPEQAIDPASASHAVDIYGLGCTWAFLLTGEPYYGSLPTAQRLIAHQVGAIVSLREQRPDLPKALDEFFQSMVAKSPAERPESMLAVAEALTAHQQNQATSKGRWMRPLAWFLALAAVGIAASPIYFTPDLTKNPTTVSRLDTQQRLDRSQRVDLQAKEVVQTGLPLYRVGPVDTKLVLIPQGQFHMGSRQKDSAGLVTEDFEFPRHQVTISKPFYLAETETTQGQFRRFVSETGYVTQPERGGWAWGMKNGVWRQGDYSWNELGNYEPSDDHPVTNVTWHDAVAYCEWLTAEAGDEQRFRLPTEAEWEDACRAGSDFDWGFGNEEQELGDYSWYLKNAGRVPQPIALKKPNAWGLYDMHGNVAEWCHDQFAEVGRYYDSTPKTDPAGIESGPLRVQRGGNCLSLADEVRSAARAHQSASNPTRGGFRVALETP